MVQQPIPALGDNREELTSPASAFQMVSMLEGVVKRGTGRRISALNLTVAGKTGTTNDNTNGWFIGFTPDLAVGVFVDFLTRHASRQARDRFNGGCSDLR